MTALVESGRSLGRQPWAAAKRGGRISSNFIARPMTRVNVIGLVLRLPFADRSHASATDRDVINIYYVHADHGDQDKRKFVAEEVLT